jgi:hypothetical protein
VLRDGQIWLNKKLVAKIEKNGEPHWKCVLFEKTKDSLKFVEVLEGPDELVITKITEHNMKLTSKTLIFA